MHEELTNADLLAAIQRLGTSVDSRFSGVETRLSSLEKTAKDTNATVNRIDIRLKSVEATVDEISVSTSLNSKAIGVLRADLEALEARVKKLENA
jgi:archaellum component FlaC